MVKKIDLKNTRMCLVFIKKQNTDTKIKMISNLYGNKTISLLQVPDKIILEKLSYNAVPELYRDIKLSYVINKASCFNRIINDYLGKHGGTINGVEGEGSSSVEDCPNFAELFNKIPLDLVDNLFSKFRWAAIKSTLCREKKREYENLFKSLNYTQRLEFIKKEFGEKIILKCGKLQKNYGLTNSEIMFLYRFSDTSDINIPDNLKYNQADDEDIEAHFQDIQESLQQLSVNNNLNTNSRDQKKEERLKELLNKCPLYHEFYTLTQISHMMRDYIINSEEQVKKHLDFILTLFDQNSLPLPNVDYYNLMIKNDNDDNVYKKLSEKQRVTLNDYIDHVMTTPLNSKLDAGL